MPKTYQILCAAAAMSLVAGVSFAADAVDAARADIARLIDRERVAVAGAAALDAHAGVIAGKVNALKAKGPAKRTILEDVELGGLLKESLDISRRQDAVADEVDAVRTALEKAIRAGLDAIKVSGRTDAAAGALADAWMAKLRGIVGPRRALRAFDVKKKNALDGPQELNDKADALKDNEERVNREIAALRTRLKEVNDERSLKSETSDFLKEHFIFDDEESRKGWSRTVEKQVSVPASDSTGGSRSTPTTAKGGTTEATSSATAPGGGTGKDKTGMPVAGGATGSMDYGGGSPDPNNNAPARGTDTLNFGALPQPAFSNTTVRTTVSGTMVQSLKGGRSGDLMDPSEEAAYLEARIKDLERQAADLSDESAQLHKAADELGKELKKK